MAQQHTVTLTPSSTWATVSELLNCPAGQYASYKFYYVMKRNGVQQTGEININDTGALVQAEHEWTVIPNDGDPAVEFDISHQNGLRVFRYKTTSGSANIIFKFEINFKFG